MRFDLFLVAIANGAMWSAVIDAALPHVFHRLPKPFGCSKCMAFWSTVIFVTLHFDNPYEFTLAGVSALVAAFGFRTFTLR